MQSSRTKLTRPKDNNKPFTRIIFRAEVSQENWRLHRYMQTPNSRETTDKILDERKQMH
jgi:hypothetical protein